MNGFRFATWRLLLLVCLLVGATRVWAAGEVWAWGNNWAGQLGDSTTTERWEPVQTHILTDIDLIAAAYYHSLAVANVSGVEEIGKSKIKYQKSKIEAYPNPFTHTTAIKLSSNQAIKRLKLQIYDLSGRLVRSFPIPINRDNQSPITISWDGRDDKGKKLAGGVYFYRLEVPMNRDFGCASTGKYKATKKLILLK